MANWKVTREQIEIFPHPNPVVERLELGKVGQYQVVVQKGLYQSGTPVIFVPEKSILPPAIADEGDRRKYLIGPNKDRVMALVMQKELTQGIILPDRPELAHIPFGEDISKLLGIERYIAPIPDELAGDVFSLTTIANDLHGHEVEIFNMHPLAFQVGEEVIVTEKIHGTQGIALVLRDGQRLVTSKGLLKNEQFFKANNAYYQAAEKMRLFDMLATHFPGENATAYYEVVPFHKGFNYNIANEKRGFIFRIDVNGQTLSHDEVPQEFMEHWVPLLYRGPFDLENIRKLREGKETVSGKSVHIKEGIVVTPLTPRRASFGRLALKLLNPKYTPDPEDFS